jgi:hypothetical protein
MQIDAMIKLLVAFFKGFTQLETKRTALRENTEFTQAYADGFKKTIGEENISPSGDILDSHGKGKGLWAKWVKVLISDLPEKSPQKDARYAFLLREHPLYMQSAGFAKRTKKSSSKETKDKKTPVGTVQIKDGTIATGSFIEVTLKTIAKAMLMLSTTKALELDKYFSVLMAEKKIGPEEIEAINSTVRDYFYNIK